MKDIIRDTIGRLERERDLKVATIVEREVKAKIIEYHKKVDETLEQFVAELAQKRDEEIAKTNDFYERQRAELVEKANIEKQTYALNETNEATSGVTAEYATQIATLRQMLETMKDGE